MKPLELRHLNSSNVAENLVLLVVLSFRSPGVEEFRLFTVMVAALVCQASKNGSFRIVPCCTPAVHSFLNVCE